MTDNQLNGHDREHRKAEPLRDKISRMEANMDNILEELKPLDSIAVSIKRIARYDLLKMLLVAAIILVVVINDRKIHLKLGPLEIGQAMAESP